MNERIKELAKQSLPASYLTNCPSALEKFAELIVRECADIVIDNSAVSGLDVIREVIAKKVKEHFGVSE
jgi:hypothetical protein